MKDCRSVPRKRLLSVKLKLAFNSRSLFSNFQGRKLKISISIYIFLYSFSIYIFLSTLFFFDLIITL